MFAFQAHDANTIPYALATKSEQDNKSDCDVHTQNFVISEQFGFLSAHKNRWDLC